MTSNNDLIDAIDIWVVVFLTLIALLDVVALIFMIRQIKSERNIALNLIDDKKHEFVRKDFKLLDISKFTRFINASNFANVSRLNEQTLLRKNETLERKQSITNWIMFVRTLNAYSINVLFDDTLKIHESRSWMFVHRLWILVVDFLKRYDHVSNQERVLNASSEKRIDQREIETRDKRALFDIIDTFCHLLNVAFSNTKQNVNRFSFISRDNDSRESLQSNDVSFNVLYWLTLRCISMIDDRVFDVSRFEYETRYESYDYYDKKTQSKKIYISIAYRFFRIDDFAIDARYISWARTLLNKLFEIWWLCEHTFTTTNDRMKMKKIFSHFDNCENTSSLWIKINMFEVDKFFLDWDNEEAFLWRFDVQCFALIIFSLNWSFRDCLYDHKRE